MAHATAKRSADIPQAIERGKVYNLKTFLASTGLGPQGLRSARDRGLRVVYEGRTAYVSGDDWNDYILAPERKTERW